MQRPVLDDPPPEGAIPPVPGSVRVSSGLNRPPVVASRDDHRVDPIHDPLVMRGCPVRVRIRKPRIRLGVKNGMSGVAFGFQV